MRGRGGGGGLRERGRWLGDEPRETGGGWQGRSWSGACGADGEAVNYYVLCCVVLLGSVAAAPRCSGFRVQCHRATHPGRPPAALPACGPWQGSGVGRRGGDRAAMVGRRVPPLFRSLSSVIRALRLCGRPPRCGTGHQRPADGPLTFSPPSSPPVVNDAPASTSAASTRRRDASCWWGAAAGRARRSVRPTGERPEGRMPGRKGRSHRSPSACLPPRAADVPLHHAAGSTAAAAAAASRCRTPRNHPPRSASST